jgi:hypothetical protein
MQEFTQTLTKSSPSIINILGKSILQYRIIFMIQIVKNENWTVILHIYFPWVAIYQRIISPIITISPTDLIYILLYSLNLFQPVGLFSFKCKFHNAKINKTYGNMRFFLCICLFRVIYWFFDFLNFCWCILDIQEKKHILNWFNLYIR